MTQSSRPVPNTPEERQAVVTVRSAKGILREIGDLRRILCEGTAAMDERSSAKRALFDASERMCNLMSLAFHQIENNINGEMQEQLATELTALRDHLLSMGTQLMIEKMRKIGERAETVLRDGNYPLGLAGKLELQYGGLLSNLKMLGGIDRLPGEDITAIERTQLRLKQLGEIEHGLGIMLEIERPKVAQQPLHPVEVAKAAIG